ncbi:hypothetical protein [Planobispora longispora]|uniref:Uncharacterized protein n=1 Tax=Planobispora longispora TaxID=28887 RepID=A0A8J3RX83_9ACTN|nr:hypothetical protein [Planobispora longispora]GIH79813.1 hypothetical protein Plo01_62420 [Planobispora longispora]
MIYNVPVEARRNRLIADLRGLAEFLERHPEVPVPRYGSVRMSVYPLYDTDATTEAEAIIEVARIATLLGVPLRVEHGHHVARADFGTVCYEAILITQAARDRRAAQDSYRDNISTDPPVGA